MDKILFRSNSTNKKYLLLMIISSVITLFIVAWVCFNSIKYNNSSMTIITAVIVVISIGAIVLQFASDSFKYVVTSSELVVKRPLGNIIIPLKDIKFIRIMTIAEKKKYRVLFAAKYPGIGKHERISKDKRPLLSGNMYHSNWVLVVTDKRKYIIAPDDLQLIDIVTQHIGQTEAEIQQPMDISKTQWARFISIAICLPVALIIYMGYRQPKILRCIEDISEQQTARSINSKVEPIIKLIDNDNRVYCPEKKCTDIAM